MKKPHKEHRKTRFGIASGIHALKRSIKRVPVTHKCSVVSELKVKITKRSEKLPCKKYSKIRSKVFRKRLSSQYYCKRTDGLTVVLRPLKVTACKGYRLINLDCLQEHLNELMKHAVVCEKLHSMIIEDKPVIEVVSELRGYGLASVLGIRCTACKHEFKFETSKKLISNDNRAKYDVNVRAVWGSVVTGNGASHLREIMATLDSPSLSQPAFTKIEQDIGNWWQNMSQDELLAAGLYYNIVVCVHELIIN